MDYNGKEWTDAAIEALRILGKESTIPEIYKIIDKKSLYSHNPGLSQKTPEKTLWNEIRRNLEGFKHKNERRPKYFYQPKRKIYGLIEWIELKKSLGEQHNHSDIEIVKKKISKTVFISNEIIPEQINEPDKYFEGSKKEITVNFYERNQKARQKCINYYGYKCGVCGLVFENVYGEIGKNYIQVHHIKPLSEIDDKYEIEPLNHLIPICANCHSMIHRTNPALSIEELKSILVQNRINTL